VSEDTLNLAAGALSCTYPTTSMPRGRCFFLGNDSSMLAMEEPFTAYDGSVSIEDFNWEIKSPSSDSSPIPASQGRHFPQDEITQHSQLDPFTAQLQEHKFSHLLDDHSIWNHGFAVEIYSDEFLSLPPMEQDRLVKLGKLSIERWKYIVKILWWPQSRKQLYLLRDGRYIHYQVVFNLLIGALDDCGVEQYFPRVILFDPRQDHADESLVLWNVKSGQFVDQINWTPVDSIIKHGCKYNTVPRKGENRQLPTHYCDVGLCGGQSQQRDTSSDGHSVPRHPQDAEGYLASWNCRE